MPDLAAGWEISDGTVYTFRLRDDQYWHDGERITAADVLFTVGILQNPEVFSLPDLASLWRSVKVEGVDDSTVRFTLSEPFTPFLDYTSIGLLPEHIWKDVPAAELATKALTAQPIGSGPLRVSELTADHVRLEPSPFYSGPQPYLSAIELHFYPDHPSIFSAFADGELESISQVLPSDLPEAASRDDLQLFSFVESNYLNILFNQRNPDVPFLQDRRVRQALLYGIDRTRLIEEVAAGQGIVAHSPLLPENWAYNPEVKRYPYDPERARQLLDEAGWIDSDGDGIRDQDGRPLRFLLHTNDDSVRTAIIERIAEEWRALGIGVEAVPVSFAQLVGDLLTTRRFHAALIGWELTGDPDPYPLWHSTQAEGGGQNYGGWSNEEVDELLQAGRSLVDIEERRKLYRRFQEIFAEEVPAALLYYPVYTYGISSRVHNVQVGSLTHASERFATFPDWFIVTRRVPAGAVPTHLPPTPPAAGL